MILSDIGAVVVGGRALHSLPRLFRGWGHGRARPRAGARWPAVQPLL